MKDFAGRTAVITGGGTGMGRELAVQLARDGCHLALCDVLAAPMAETQCLCADANPAVRVTTRSADVSDEAQMTAFRDAVAAAHGGVIHLLFNNAGIGGGGSMILNTRAQWERTFDICWRGVYLGTRLFLPLLLKADAGHIVNTSSVNGFWASIGPGVPHTAYSAAKFAVKGFTEALVGDLRLNAPHIACSVVMPGHIGTSIVGNSRTIVTGDDSGVLTAHELKMVRARLSAAGNDVSQLSDADIQAATRERIRMFHDDAPTTAAQAATIILDGVRDGRWRILVGDDAHEIDRRVRADPEGAYEPAFFEGISRDIGWKLG